jgi:hypothetical protein
LNFSRFTKTLDEKKFDAVTASEIGKKIHEYGINFRYSAIIYSRIQTIKNRDLLGADMVARAVF